MKDALPQNQDAASIQVPMQALIPELDVLRAAAIVGVVVLHCTAPLLTLVDRSSTGFYLLVLLDQSFRFCVPAFLVLSGILLTLGSRNTRHPDLTLRRRLTRLLVPYLFWSLVFQVIRILQGSKAADWHTALSLAVDLLWGTTVVPYYFVILIAQFYVLWWLLVRLGLVSSGRLLLVFAAVQSCYVVYFYLAQARQLPPELLSGQLPFGWCFFFGFGLYWGSHWQTVHLFFSRYTRQLWGIAALALAASVAETDWLQRQGVHLGFGALAFYKLSTSLYALSVVTLTVRYARGWAPISTLARFSFAIYLIHPPLVESLAPLLAPWGVPGFCLLLVVGLGLPWSSAVVGSALLPAPLAFAIFGTK